MSEGKNKTERNFLYGISHPYSTQRAHIRLPSGHYLFTIPWTINLNYMQIIRSVTLPEAKFCRSLTFFSSVTRGS